MDTLPLNHLLETTIYKPWYNIEETKSSRDIAKTLLNTIEYYDSNATDDASLRLTKNIADTKKQYEEYCQKCALDNIKPQSYCIYDFLHKNRLIFKIKELTPYLSETFPDGIIKEIALYSNHIYAKGVHGGNIHFSYHAIEELELLSESR